MNYSMNIVCSGAALLDCWEDWTIIIIPIMLHNCCGRGITVPCPQQLYSIMRSPFI